MKFDAHWTLIALLVAGLVAACNSGGDALADQDEATASGGNEGTETTNQAGEYSVSTEVVSTDAGNMLVAVVEPGSGFHINLDFPWNLSMDTASASRGGEAFGSDATAEFVDARVRYEIPIEAVGEYGAELRLSVCNDNACLTPREQLAWNVE